MNCINKNNGLKAGYERYKGILKNMTLSRKQDDTELGRLMHDFHCRDAEEIYSEALAKRVYELKETQEGVDRMCREMDEIYREGEKAGVADWKDEFSKVRVKSPLRRRRMVDGSSS